MRLTSFDPFLSEINCRFDAAPVQYVVHPLRFCYKDLNK